VAALFMVVLELQIALGYSALEAVLRWCRSRS